VRNLDRNSAGSAGPTVPPGVECREEQARVTDIEQIFQAFTMAGSPAAARTRLRWLKIAKHKYLAPGTYLDFNETYNVLLGQNGTGKTTLLDLITMILTADFSAVKGESFAIEYELSYPGLTITASLRNDASAWSSTLAIQIDGVPATHTIAATPSGATLQVGDQPPSSTPVRLPSPFEPGHVRGALLKVAEAVEPHHREPIFTAAVVFAQVAANLFRFDEALGGFHVMTGGPPAERVAHGPAARFELTKNHRLAPGMRTFLPAQFWSLLAARMPDLMAAKGARLGHAEVDFLRKAVEVMHFKEAELSLRLLKKDVTSSGERLVFGDFELLFTLADGSIINQNDLSYGQKRLLSFFYYAAANEHVIVADELVNGLHHEWIETCRDEIEGRQSFLTSQNPLLLDFLFFSSPEEVQRCFVLCRNEEREGHPTMVMENLSAEEAAAFYRAYQTEVQHVSEILRTKGLW
jgi:energy-coupling factor transporter ATP-binding protein EcfA2